MTWIVQQAVPVCGASPQSASLTGVLGTDELIVIVVGELGASGQTISSVEETTTTTALTNVVPYTVAEAATSGRYQGFGIWKLDSPPASPSITVTASSGEVALFVIESSVTGLALDVASAIASFTGSVTAYTTASISSSFSNELWIAIASAAAGGGYTFGSWTNGFVSGNNYHGANVPNCNWAWVQESSTASQDVSSTISSGTPGNAVLFALKTSTSAGAPAVTTVNGSLPPPIQNTASTSATGGSLVSGTYTYYFTAYDATGETQASNSQVISISSGTTNENSLSCSAVTGATGYKLYKNYIGTSSLNVVYDLGNTTSFTDTGTAGSPVIGLPTSSNTTMPPIVEGSTAVPMTGTNFASGMTANIVQGANTVAQANVVYTNSTTGSFNLTMEPGTGVQLAFTDSVYSAGLEITVSSTTSASFPVSLTPPTGLIFKTLTSVNPIGSYRITAIPDLVANDQLEASSTSTGLPLGAPAGLSVSTSTTGGTGLAASTTYYYEVTGLTAGGESVGQTAVSVTTGAGSTNSNNVTWTALAGAESYRVYRSLSSSMTSAVYYAASTNSYLDTGATGTSGSVPTSDTTAAAPPGLVLNSDATFEYGSGYSAASFYVRAYDSSTSAWDAYALQTVSTGDLASAGYNVSTAKAATFTSAIHLGAGGRNVSTGEATLNTVIPFSTRGGNISRGAGSFLTSISFFASGSSRNSGTASASTSITLAAAGRDRSTGSSEASTAIRLGAHGFNRSAALGTPTTAIVLRANGYDVSGGVGEPFTQISLRSYGLGVNTGTGDLRFQAVFSASGRSVSTGRGEPSTLVSLKSAGRNRVESFGLIAYGVTFIARGASTSRGTGTLSTSIALRALGQNVSTSLNAFRIVLRYGYSTVVPVSNTGVQAAESAYVSGSALYVDCAYFDSTGLPFVPNGLSYRVDDVASGMNIVPATALPVATTTTIQITGAQNYMVNLSRSFEEHQITVAITDGYGQTYYRTATYDVVAPGWSA